jgi:hypothetical protein
MGEFIITNPFCKKNDWIILKEEFIKDAHRIYPFTIHCPGKVKFIDGFGMNDVVISTNEGQSLINSKYFRFATDVEIKKEKIRKMFTNRNKENSL